MSDHDFPHGIAVIGVREYQVTKRAAPHYLDQSMRTVTTRQQHCIAWCGCGWRSPVIISTHRAKRAGWQHIVEQEVEEEDDE